MTANNDAYIELLRDLRDQDYAQDESVGMRFTQERAALDAAIRALSADRGEAVPVAWADPASMQGYTLGAYGDFSAGDKSDVRSVPLYEAPVNVGEWPDAASVERAAEALYGLGNNANPYSNTLPEIQATMRVLACTVLNAATPPSPAESSAFSFDALVASGLAQGVPTTHGLPWSFTYMGLPVTHENDNRYLVNMPDGTTLNVYRNASPAAPSGVSDADIDRMLRAFHGDGGNFHHIQWTADQRRSMRDAVAAIAHPGRAAHGGEDS